MTFYTKKQLTLAVVSSCVCVGRLSTYIEHIKNLKKFSELLVTLPDFRHQGEFVEIDLLLGEQVYGFYSHLLNIYNVLIKGDSKTISMTFSKLPNVVLEEIKEIVHKDFDFNY